MQFIYSKVFTLYLQQWELLECGYWNPGIRKKNWGRGNQKLVAGTGRKMTKHMVNIYLTNKMK